MKRYLISIVAILVVSGLAWVSFGQAEGPAGGRSDRAAGKRGNRAMYRERQQQAISAIEQQLAKMKSAMESFSAGPRSGQNLSDEERTKLRAKFREERLQSIAIIEEQLAKLKGRRGLQAEHEESISELNAIRESAIKEKATQTASTIEKLITQKKKAFEERMQKLGLPERPSRRGN
ncbi:MAG TPA: hypothetical protein VMW16_13775 [Sedimentisphaerales bacterium]|nr:hypothetical protein [Sedimentisphaerales bacterium]